MAWRRRGNECNNDKKRVSSTSCYERGIVGSVWKTYSLVMPQESLPDRKVLLYQQKQLRRCRDNEGLPCICTNNEFLDLGLNVRELKSERS